jgi:flagella basal body P-ring formation protein FlgA
MLMIKILLSLFLLNSNYSTIENYLKKHLQNYKKYEVTISSQKEISAKQFIPDETREFKLERNYAYVPVNIILENGAISQGILTLKLKLYKDVYVAARKIYKNEELSASDFMIEEKEISSLRVDPISSVKNIEKFKARFNISSETVIGANMLEPIPDVKIGDNVHAIYSKGVVNISFDAVARKSGVIGDIINIKNEEKKIFKAEILSYNTVKIVE